MSELHHSLETMGVVQYLFAVAFLICYALAIGDFLGPASRGLVVGLGFASAVAFSAATSPWVHGVLLTAFAVMGIGMFLGLAWLLKALLARAVGEVSVEAAYDDAVSAILIDEPADPAPAHRPPADASPAIGRLLGSEQPSLDQRAS